MSSCRGCGATVVWLITRSGRRICVLPLDIHGAQVAESETYSVARHQAHLGKCPGASLPTADGSRQLWCERCGAVRAVWLADEMRAPRGGRLRPGSLLLTCERCGLAPHHTSPPEAPCLCQACCVARHFTGERCPDGCALCVGLDKLREAHAAGKVG